MKQTHCTNHDGLLSAPVIFHTTSPPRCKTRAARGLSTRAPYIKRGTKRSITIAHAGKQMLRTVTRTARRRFAAPATKKKKKKGKNDDDNPQDGATAFYRAILDAPRKTRPKFSEEEARRNFEIGARYNKLSRIKHCEFEAGLQLKLDLQQYALASLPPDLRKQAMSLEDVPLPPLDRRFWALTPPIPGFKPEAYPDDDED